ncbi:MAG: amidinotransferase [Cyclobacteriaceae bacterium]
MIQINIKDETSPLEAVVLGSAFSFGGTPKLEDAYDPKSLEHIKAGTYPKEPDMLLEMEAFDKVFKKYGVEVYRPKNIENCNQIFARDIAFVIDNTLVKSNILPDRENELEAISYIIDEIDSENVIRPSEDVHIEGGDVMLWQNYILVGTYHGEDYPDYITARTNAAGVEFLKRQFPNRIVKEFDLSKSRINARENALHLDCCFQPVGLKYGIIHKEGFRKPADYEFLVDLFGHQNLFHIDAEEMYHMNSNVFSIAPDVVVVEQNFNRLTDWLMSKKFKVEKIPYAEIAKQEGLLRCSTLPLRRTDV